MPRRWLSFIALASLLAPTAFAQSVAVQLEDNKRIAREFYEHLWMTNNTDRYADYVADTYVVHDVGDRKNVTEAAIEQKNIADFFWANGNITARIDYQVAEGDRVATRWFMYYAPTTLLGKTMLGEGEIPIINVFRIEDGKIVEIWNHRHDIDTGQTRRFVLEGAAFGVGIMLIPLVLLWRSRRRLAARPGSSIRS